jgi:hypothetical protein
MIKEKKTRETYSSKKAMMKHEKGESKVEQKKEMKKPMPPTRQVGTPRPQPKSRLTVAKAESPTMMKVSKKTAYNIKEASNQKLTASARKHYAENAQAAMKNKKSPAPKMKKC